MPQNAEIVDTLGWVYFQREMLALAITTLEEAVRLAPTNPLYAYRLGVAYTKNGEDAKARKSLEGALKLRPDFERAEDARKCPRQARVTELTPLPAPFWSPAGLVLQSPALPRRQTASSAEESLPGACFLSGRNCNSRHSEPAIVVIAQAFTAPHRVSPADPAGSQLAWAPLRVEYLSSFCLFFSVRRPN